MQDYKQDVAAMMESAARLSWKADTLRTWGRVILLLVVLTVLLSVATLSSLAGGSAASPVLGLGSSTMLASILALLSIVLWRQVREDAMIWFEELSDEFEWSHRTYRPRSFTGSNEPDENVAGHRPPIEVRVQLRSLLKAAELPLVPIASGPIVFFTLVLLGMGVAIYSIVIAVSRTWYM